MTALMTALVLLQDITPTITPFFDAKMALSTTLALVSTALFIWSKIEWAATRRAVEQTSVVTQRSLEVLAKVSDHLGTMETTMVQLVRDQQAGMQRILETQATLVATLTTIGNGTQRLAEQLIDILKDAKE